MGEPRPLTRTEPDRHPPTARRTRHTQLRLVESPASPASRIETLRQRRRGLLLLVLASLLSWALIAAFLAVVL